MNLYKVILDGYLKISEVIECVEKIKASPILINLRNRGIHGGYGYYFIDIDFHNKHKSKYYNDRLNRVNIFLRKEKLNKLLK